MRTFGALPQPINYVCIRCGAIISIQIMDTPPTQCAKCKAEVSFGGGFTPYMDQIRGPRV